MPEDKASILKKHEIHLYQYRVNSEKANFVSRPTRPWKYFKSKKILVGKKRNWKGREDGSRGVNIYMLSFSANVLFLSLAILQIQSVDTQGQSPLEHENTSTDTASPSPVQTRSLSPGRWKSISARVWHHHFLPAVHEAFLVNDV